MLYVTMRAIHLLSIVAWVGGMFFMLACLRPAAAVVLEPPARLRLMHATMRRFFAIVIGAVVLVLLSGGVMFGLAASTAARTGLRFNMPLNWYVMVGGFVVMLAVFAHARLILFNRLGAAVDAQAWPAGAAAVGTIRISVLFNLVVGIFVIIAMVIGGTI